MLVHGDEGAESRLAQSSYPRFAENGLDRREGILRFPTQAIVLRTIIVLALPIWGSAVSVSWELEHVRRPFLSRTGGADRSRICVVLIRVAGDFSGYTVKLELLISVIVVGSCRNFYGRDRWTTLRERVDSP